MIHFDFCLLFQKGESANSGYHQSQEGTRHLCQIRYVLEQESRDVVMVKMNM